MSKIEKSEQTLVGGCCTLSSQPEEASSQVNDAGNDWLCSFRWSWQWFKLIFQINRELQADTNHPWPDNVHLVDESICLKKKQVALKVATLHKINDPYVSKSLKRESTIMEKLNHPIIVSLEKVVSVGSSYWCLVVDSVPWRQSRQRLEARGSSASSCTRSRCLFNCDHDFYDDDGNDEMSMNMIVTTKEVFQLKKYVQKRKNNVCSGLLLNEESSSSPHPAQDLAFRGSGICPVQL